MKAFTNRAILVLALTVGSIGGVQAQEWLLNSGASRFYMQTVKANSIFEIHQFTGLDGSISGNGDATVKIDLTSVASGIDVRDVRMRFLLFETYKFPNATTAIPRVRRCPIARRVLIGAAPAVGHPFLDIAVPLDEARRRSRRMRPRGASVGGTRPFHRRRR